MANHVLDYNGEDDEDEALRKAIALSLGHAPSTPKPEEIDLTADDDSDGEKNTKNASHPVPVPAPKPPRAATSSLSALGLDRKRMEEERLARLNKRKASELSPTAGELDPRPQQRQKTAELSEKSTSVTSSRVAAAGPSKPNQSIGPLNPLVVETRLRPGPSLPFPQGVVKKTWVRGQPRLGDDITIEEVLQKEKLEIAVLSSFQWAADWMLSKIDVARTRMLLIAFAADEDHVGDSPPLIAPSC